MTTYHFVAASERFLTVEEPLEEVLRERQRNYAETGKTIDFWLVKQPAFLSSPELAELKATIPPARCRCGVHRSHLHHLPQTPFGVRGCGDL